MLRELTIQDIAVVYSEDLDKVLFMEITSKEWNNGELKGKSQLLFAMPVDDFNKFRKKLKKVKKRR